MARFSVCLDPEVENETFEADGFYMDDNTGMLKLLRKDNTGKFTTAVVFPPGKWVYFERLDV